VSLSNFKKPPQQYIAAGPWLRTSDAVTELGISRDTLLRRSRDGYLRAGEHFIAAGPHRTSPRLWSATAVRLAMAGWTGVVQSSRQEVG
jgi:hypothetical protein